jgi:hypothetical protein
MCLVVPDYVGKYISTHQNTSESIDIMPACPRNLSPLQITEYPIQHPTRWSLALLAMSIDTIRIDCWNLYAPYSEHISTKPRSLAFVLIVDSVFIVEFFDIKGSSHLVMQKCRYYPRILLSYLAMYHLFSIHLFIA